MGNTIITPWESHLDHRLPTVRGRKGTIKNYGCSFVTKPFFFAPLSETETLQICSLQIQFVSRPPQTSSDLSLYRGYPSKQAVSPTNPTTVRAQAKQSFHKILEENIAVIIMSDMKKQRLAALTDSTKKHGTYRQ
jgi:hypothetical protein